MSSASGALPSAKRYLGGGVVYGDGSPVGGFIETSSDAGATWVTQLVGDGT